MKAGYSTVLTLIAGLCVPMALAAQNREDIQPRHHHYKLIDLGTFGGPQSFTNEELQVLNNRGMVAGTADTSVPNHPNACFLCGGAFIDHAFLWSNGVLRDLGSLPGSNTSSANWISDSGLVAGFSETEAIDPLLGVRELHAVLWKNGEIVDLGALEGGYESAAFAVNSRGQVAGAGFNAVPDPFSFTGTQQRTFLWEKGVLRDLGTLGGPDAGLLGFLGGTQLGGAPVGKGNVEMNERGQVVACSYINSTPNAGTGMPTVDPFLWEEKEGMQDLGSLGGTSGCAINLNNRGQVVGYSNLAGDLAAHPFLWTKPGPMRDLGTLGGTLGFANWISEAGEVAGTASVEGGQIHAFLWKNGITTDLGTVPGDSCSMSQAVNSKHQMVGESVSCDFTSQRAFLWENGGPMVDLNTLIPPGSDLYLWQAININDRGEISGFGMLPNGDSHAYLLIPCDENHPDIHGCDYSQVEVSTVAASLVTETPKPLTPQEISRIRDLLMNRHRGFMPGTIH